LKRTSLFLPEVCVFLAGAGANMFGIDDALDAACNDDGDFCVINFGNGFGLNTNLHDKSSLNKAG